MLCCMHSCTLSLTSESGTHMLRPLCTSTHCWWSAAWTCSSLSPLSRHMAEHPGQLPPNRHPSVSVTLGRHNHSARTRPCLHSPCLHSPCLHASLPAQSLLHTDTKPAATSSWRMYTGESVRTNTHQAAEACLLIPAVGAAASTRTTSARCAARHMASQTICR